MQEIRIESTKNSPEVSLDPSGTIRIKGRSIMENAAEFYEPVENWITEYIAGPAPVTTVNITLEYFNSASARIFITLFQKITFVALKDKRYIFNWYYEEGDDDIFERGEYFSSVLDIPINYIMLG